MIRQEMANGSAARGILMGKRGNACPRLALRSDLNRAYDATFDWILN